MAKQIDDTIEQNAQQDLDDVKNNKKVRKGVTYAAEIGYTTKGIFYITLGIVALQAAIQAGTAHIKIHTVLLDILAQPYGQLLLWVMILGIAGYVIWRVAQSILDLDHKGDSAFGLVQRASYLGSAIGYTVLAYTGIKLLIGQTRSQASINFSKAIQFIYNVPLGGVLVGVAGLIFMGVGFFQFYRTATANFRHHFDWSELRGGVSKVVIILGRIGYAARGVLYLLIGFSMAAAAITLNPGRAGGFGSAFQTLDVSGSFPWFLAADAIGLMIYGVYAILLARYRKFAQPKGEQ